MAQQTINIGTVVNDGTGDPIRTAFDKTNQNFTELYNTISTSAITTNGVNVGIGTSTPNSKLVVVANTANSAVRITQVGTGNALLVEDSANPDATPFIITNNGSVVRGHTALIATVNYAGAAMTPGLQQHSTTIDAFGATAWTSSTTSAPSIVLSKSKSGTVGTHAVVANGDVLGAININGSDGTNFDAASAILGVVDGTPSTGSVPGRLEFRTTSAGSSAPVERMRIRSDGGISIGGAGSTATQLSITGTLVSSSNITRSVAAIGTAPTTATTEVSGFYSSLSTADGITGLTHLYNFVATQGTITGGTRVIPTNQYGFHSTSTLTGATNNYGFYGNVPAGTGRWNFYAAGSANNYFAGATIIASNTLNVGTSSNNGANGSVWLPNGMKMCWGVLTVNTTSVATYSNAFPTATVSVTVTPMTTTHLNANTIYVSSVNTTAAVIRSASTTTTANAYYMAIGY